MKKTSKTIIFFGNERLATGVSTTAPALSALIGGGYRVAAVVVAQNAMGRSRRPRDLEVAALAEKHAIPLLAPADLAGAQPQLAGFGAQAAVLIAYGRIVPPAVLSVFPRGIVNVHPSLLPLHRGSTPIESVILGGASETGVSLMRLSAKMDAGPLYEQVRLPLTGSETKQELADASAAIGTDLLMKHLPAILGGGGPAPTDQDDDNATYDEHLAKADGLVDWSAPAPRLEREIRAYAGWPKSRASLGSIEVIITQAALSDSGAKLKPGAVQTDDKRLIVGCGEGALEILALKPAGRPEMPAAAFLAGYKL